MKSRLKIREAIGRIIFIAIVLITIVSPPVLIVWSIWSGRYITAVAFAAVYIIMLVLWYYVSYYVLEMWRSTEFPEDEQLHKFPEDEEYFTPSGYGRAGGKRVHRRIPAKPVDFSVFAPQQIARGETFVLNLWVHFREQLDAVMTLSQLLRPSDVVGFRAGVPVELGTEIVFRLQLPTLDIHDELDKVMWTGRPSNTSFRIGVPLDITNTEHDGHFDVYTDGIRIARVLFSVTLSSEEPSISQRRLQSRIERLRTAFASYSSVDRVEVLGRI